MDTLWIILGIVLMLVGIAGCILPFLPGPPLAFGALLIQQLREHAPFSSQFLIWWAVIAAIVTLLDYVIPVYGTKKFGGTKYGVWGSTVGLIAGLFIPPLGLIIGPFVGAFVGEMIASSNSRVAFRAAVGSFVGFVVGTMLKIAVCLVMAWYLAVSFF